MRKSLHPKPRPRLSALDILGLRFSLLDDAGSQRFVDVYTFWRGRWGFPHEQEPEVRFARRFVGPTIVQYAVFFAACALMGGVGGWVFWNPTPVGLLGRAALIAIPVMLLLVFFAARFRRRSDRYITLMKARALCPACIHSLKGLPVPTSGLVPCPECGAKWRLDVVPSPPPGSVV